MKVRLANLIDLKQIKVVYDNAVNHMIDEGNISQWTDYSSFEKGEIKYIDQNCFYVVEREEEIIGVFALIYGVDETYNKIKGKWINDDEYVTIHKIAVKYYQQHIASFILDYVVNCIKLKFINNIRIDTHKDNISMKTFLKKNKFTYCGVISITNDFSDKPSLRNAYIREF